MSVSQKVGLPGLTSALSTNLLFPASRPFASFFRDKNTFSLPLFFSPINTTNHRHRQNNNRVVQKLRLTWQCWTPMLHMETTKARKQTGEIKEECNEGCSVMNWVSYYYYILLHKVCQINRVGQVCQVSPDHHHQMWKTKFVMVGDDWTLRVVPVGKEGGVSIAKWLDWHWWTQCTGWWQPWMEKIKEPFSLTN